MATVLNHDVAGLCRRLNRFIIELQKSASSSVSDMSTFDQDRLQSYLDAIKSYRSWVISQPQLDLPETHPKEIEIGKEPETPDVDNEGVRDTVYMMGICRDEIVNSQSARRASGFISFDDRRLMAIVDKCQHFLDDYIKLVQPIDMPETSPLNETTGAGSLGV